MMMFQMFSTLAAGALVTVLFASNAALATPQFGATDSGGYGRGGYGGTDPPESRTDDLPPSI